MMEVPSFCSGQKRKVIGYSKKIILFALMVTAHLAVFGQVVSQRYLPMCGIQPGEEPTSALQNEDAALRGKLFCKLEVVPVNKPHYWFLYLEDIEGVPVEDATITATGINFDIGRFIKKKPTVSKHIGYGHYLVRNVAYHTRGNWTMRFKVFRGEHDVQMLSFDIVVGEDHAAPDNAGQ